VSAEGDFGAGRGPGRVSIVGAGQVGTMLGMALMAAEPGAGVTEVTLFDREPAVAKASLQRGSAYRALGRVDEALEADAVVLALPVPAILSFLEELGDRLQPGSFLIDTGSAKVAVAAAMRRTVPSTVHAIGGHPMAGTEVPGPGGATPELCRGAPFALVPVREDPVALARGHDLVGAVGAIPVEVDEETHDRTVARTSHLPHLLAFAVALVVRDAVISGPAVPALASTGLSGATRLAGSDPQMVAGFLWANAPHVRQSVAELTGALSELTAAIDDGPERLAEVLAGVCSSPEPPP
jgi:prephenate dehydrogenase